MKVVHVENDILFSHAGVTNYWLNNVSTTKNLNEIVPDDSLEINYIKGTSPYGDTISNGPLWVRPASLRKDYLDGYRQVVGHTAHNKIRSYGNITICDCLPYEYLTIIDGEFIINENEN